MIEINKLGDIPDMERYLLEDCYCPGEVYSPDGFFFEVFEADCVCSVIARGYDVQDSDFLAVVSQSTKNQPPQILFIWTVDGHIDNMQRIDATENNIRFAKAYAANKANGMHIDEYENGSTAKSLSKVFAMSDAIIVD